MKEFFIKLLKLVLVNVVCAIAELLCTKFGQEREALY